MNFKLLAMLALVSASAQAETVVLKTLETLDGGIVSQNEAFIELQVEFGIMRVPVDKILRIEADTPEKIAEREAKAAKEREFLDKMKAEGKILFRGKWMTPDEKAAKLAAEKKKQDEEKQKAAELARQQEQQRVAEAAAQAKQLQEQQRLLQQQQQQYQRQLQQPYQQNQYQQNQYRNPLNQYGSTPYTQNN